MQLYLSLGMNWNYITGFFDADGSVTLVHPGNSKRKTVQISFHNNELNILESIKNFIYNETGLNGHISIKKARKETHNDSYDLKYVYRSASSLIQYIDTIHPKKQHRFKVYSDIQNITPRNGKYTPEALEKREKLEELFWNH